MIRDNFEVWLARECWMSFCCCLEINIFFFFCQFLCFIVISMMMMIRRWIVNWIDNIVKLNWKCIESISMNSSSTNNKDQSKTFIRLSNWMFFLCSKTKFFFVISLNSIRRYHHHHRQTINCMFHHELIFFFLFEFILPIIWWSSSLSMNRMNWKKGFFFT